MIILSKQISYFLISENITPIGDGNVYSEADDEGGAKQGIRKNITPIGDGNS